VAVIPAGASQASRYQYRPELVPEMMIDMRVRPDSLVRGVNA
jgi:hypothetical protein